MKILNVSLSCGLFKVQALTLKVPQERNGICSHLFPPMVFTVLANKLRTQQFRAANKKATLGHFLFLSTLSKRSLNQLLTSLMAPRDLRGCEEDQPW